MEERIIETYDLPSKGKLYKKRINPVIKLRSMTGLEEKKRLSQPRAIYDVMASVVDDCTIDKEVSSYDLFIGDFQYLMHKLRVVTYGNQYQIPTMCANPTCKHIQDNVIDLDTLPIRELDEDMENSLELELPKSKKKVKLKILTPRILDQIETKAREIKKKSPDYVGDPKFLLTLEAMIETIDGEVPSPAELTKFVENGLMADMNAIDKTMRKINFGIDTICSTKCKECGMVYRFDLPITGEFFGPSL